MINTKLVCNALIFLSHLPIMLFAQADNVVPTEKVWRVNFLNPAIELELPIGKRSSFSTNLGIGYGGGYPDLTYNGNGFVYIVSPFLDIQQKLYYNLERRKEKGLRTKNNSGNFVSLRFVSRGPSVVDNVDRTSDFDFAIGPSWGIQRSSGENFHILFSLGPQYYFDTLGSGNFWPIMAEVNLGFDLD